MAKLYKPKVLGESKAPAPIHEGPEPILYVGHCIDILNSLPENSVHVAVTSPPYKGVRSYKTPPVVWDGADSCEHEWGKPEPGDRQRWGDISSLSKKQRSNRGSHTVVKPAPLPPQNGYSICQKCGAVKCELGQEPTSELYIRHLVQVFRALRRVLHPTGIFFLNIADSRVGSGKGQMGDGSHSLSHGDKQGTNKGTMTGGNVKGIRERTDRSPYGIPDRIKEALVADGWIHVTTITTPKGNPMTQSCRGPRWVKHYIKVKKSSIKGSGKQAEVGGTYAGFNERWARQKHRHSNHMPTGSGGVFYHDVKVDGEPAEWILCPGCKECNPNKGRVLRKGHGRPTDATEVIHVFAKTEDFFWNTERVRKGRLAESSVGRAERYAAALEKYGSPEREDSKHAQAEDLEEYAFAGLTSGRSPDAYNASGGNSLNWLGLEKFFDPRLIRMKQHLTPEEEVELFMSLPEEAMRFFDIIEPGLDPNVIKWRSEPSSDEHYAIFPSWLPAYCIQAGCSEWVCGKCGVPFAPVIGGDTHDDESEEDEEWKRACGADESGEYHGEAQKDYADGGAQNASEVKARILKGMKKRMIVDWWPCCTCCVTCDELGLKSSARNRAHAETAHPVTPYPKRKPVVIDPFAGSGTTLKVARTLGFPSIGIEIKAEYSEIANKKAGLTGAKCSDA